mmetsp:Transcript_131889/g.294020  ORF Transcript_131889/g.294020 Transcript_131889/m.294020 type:complete len:232 (+) Transcript_131889:530-1225(+)
MARSGQGTRPARQSIKVWRVLCTRSRRPSKCSSSRPRNSSRQRLKDSVPASITTEAFLERRGFSPVLRSEARAMTLWRAPFAALALGRWPAAAPSTGRSRGRGSSCCSRAMRSRVASMPPSGPRLMSPPSRLSRASTCVGLMAGLAPAPGVGAPCSETSETKAEKLGLGCFAPAAWANRKAAMTPWAWFWRRPMSALGWRPKTSGLSCAGSASTKVRRPVMTSSPSTMGKR